MAIDFGKTGREIPGVGVLLSGSEEQVLRRHRDQERKRMGPPLDRMTQRELERLQVYIYNVGPFGRTMDTLGSMGVVVIPGLDKDKCLKGLSVAGPVIRQARPEAYPSEPAGRFLTSQPSEFLRWQDADGEIFMLAERPSIDEALRIIGGHEQSKKNPYAASPYEQGCFVSVVQEQKEPKEPKEPSDKASREAKREYSKALLDYEEDVRLWLKWEASVQAAQRRFTDWAMRRGEEQTLAYASGKYERDEELFILRDIFDKTEKDWPFLAGTSANVKTKPCWSCGRSVAAGIPKCQCGELQISQAEYDKRRAEVLAGSAA